MKMKYQMIGFKRQTMKDLYAVRTVAIHRYIVKDSSNAGCAMTWIEVKVSLVSMAFIAANGARSRIGRNTRDCSISYNPFSRSSTITFQ
jgi:hypothetical protein